jgi:hypothetical protein
MLKQKEKEVEQVQPRYEYLLENFGKILNEIKDDTATSSTSVRAVTGSVATPATVKFLGLLERRDQGKQEIAELYSEYSKARIFDALSRALHTSTPDSKCVAVYNAGENVFVFSRNNQVSTGKQDNHSNMVKNISQKLEKILGKKGNDDQYILSLDNKLDQVLSHSMLGDKIKNVKNLIQTKNRVLDTSYAPAAPNVIEFLGNKDSYFEILDSIFLCHDGYDISSLSWMFFMNNKINGDLASIQQITSLLRPLHDISKLLVYTEGSISIRQSSFSSRLTNNDGELHAEVISAKDVIDSQRNEHPYIGISKYSCLFCDAFLDDYNFNYRGWHDTAFVTGYIFPKIEEGTKSTGRSLAKKTYAFKKDMFCQDHELSDDELPSSDGESNKDVFVEKYNALYKVGKIITQVGYFLWYVYYGREEVPEINTACMKQDFNTKSTSVKSTVREDDILLKELSSFQKINIAKIFKSNEQEYQKIADNPLVKKLYITEENDTKPIFRAETHWKNDETRFKEVQSYFNDFDNFVSAVIGDCQ